MSRLNAGAIERQCPIADSLHAPSNSGTFSRGVLGAHGTVRASEFAIRFHILKISLFPNVSKNDL